MNISLVTYNTPQYQLDRLYSTVEKSKLVEEVIVVDNTKDNRGYGRAHNIALRQSIEKHVKYHLVMNADIEFDASILETMCRFMDEHEEVALLSPKVYYPNGEVQHLCKLLPTPFDVFARRFLPKSWFKARRDRYEMLFSDYNHIMSVPYLSGCFMLLRISALEEVGLFDERFFMYPEDIDLTRRLHQRYKTLFFPEVSVVHNHERASYKSMKMTWIHAFNMCKYFNKWGWLVDHERRAINQEIEDQYSMPNR